MPAEDLASLQAEATRRFATNPLFGKRTGDGTWTWMTYAEFGAKVDAARAALASLGATKGDRVATISDNRIEWAIGAYGTYGLGAAWVPMYEKQHPSEWHFILSDCEARIVFVGTDAVRAKLHDLRADLAIHHVIVMEGPAGEGAITFDEFLGLGDTPPDLVPGPDDLAGLIYTSGTTGRPKGVMLSHRNIASNVNALNEVFPLEQDDRSASFLPWAHSFGQTVELHTLMSQGASTGLTTAGDLMRDLPEIRPTILVSVPLVFNRIYDALQKRMEAEGGVTKSIFDAAMKNEEARRRLREQGKTTRWVEMKHAVFDKLVFAKVRAGFGGRMKYAFSGGAAISQEVARFIDSLGILVYEGYGLTETSPVVTANTREARKIGSVGRPLPGVRVDIDTDATGDPDVGEIIVHGPNVMMGYYGLPEENAKVFTDDGGFRTGDLGHLDEEGFLFIRGRIKEQYKLENGKYVVPSPIEEQLVLSGFISQVMVYGEQKPYNVAVIVPDSVALRKWAEAEGIPEEDMSRLLELPSVRELFEAEIAKASRKIKGYERVRKFVLVPEEWTPENGFLTPSLKVKRRSVLKAFGDRIEQLYAGDEH